MKKSMVFLFAIMGSMVSVSALAQKNNQKSSGGKCFDENTHLINLGIGFGNSYYAFNHNNGYESGRTPVFLLSYEQPLRNKVGPGYIGVGGLFAFQNAHERYNYDYWYNSGYVRYYDRHNWNTYVITGRATYHWDGLIADKAEVYGGSLIGVRINSYSYSTNNKDPYYPINSRDEGSVYPVITVFAGARYYFAPNVAVYSEIASGVSFLSAGLTFKF